MLRSPADPDVQKLHRWIDSHQEAIISGLQGVLRVPSVRADAAPGAPFGQPIREALEYTLALCAQLGFRTKNVEGYAGHAEFGEGEEMVAALGHLDVVPAGEGWTYDPYGAVIEEGYLYARGSFDDKGPTYAALFAAKALMTSGLPLKRRVRVIFGCNEESGFGCVKHYWEVAKEERPVVAFTSDGWFPLVYAQKGYARLVLEKALPSGDFPLRITSARSGLPQMTPHEAEATLAGTPEALYQALVALHRHWDKNVSYEPREDGLIVRASGRSAHLLGNDYPIERLTGDDSAVARLARALSTLELHEKEVWIHFVVATVDPTGTALGIAHTDEVTGPLTCAMDSLEYTESGCVRLTFTVRYPATLTFDAVMEALRPVREACGWSVADSSDRPSHCIPLDEEPVPTLLRVYQEETGDHDSRPITMTGGSYIRATPHCAGFGAEFPGHREGPPHQPNERFAVATLLAAAKIYAHALYELAR